MQLYCCHFVRQHTVIVLMPRMNGTHTHVLAFVFPFTNVFYYRTLFMFSNGFFPVVVQVVCVTVIPTMVQKYQSPVRVYKHPFELVMAVSVSTCTSVDPLST